MQEKSINEVIGSAVLAAKASRDKPKRVVHEEMQKVAAENRAALPDYYRTPTAEELFKMRTFAKEYKRTNKRASKREIRIETQKRFNIRIIK